MIVATINRYLVVFFLVGGGLLVSSWAQAANWIFLQGTETQEAPEKSYRFFGFIQPTYQYVENKKIAVGPWKGQKAVFNQVAPDFKRNSQFQLVRARLGVRGELPRTARKINYFILSEWGKNSVTQEVGVPTVMDASVTFSVIPGARVRVGQFKYPGSEEGLLAIFRFPYVSYSNVSAQLMQERFFDEWGTGSGSANPFNGSVGAYRDVGVQIFDRFTGGVWEHTYALMVGNGNGIDRLDNNEKKDLYLYWASESPQDPWAWKISAWGQWGVRTIGNEDYVRHRSGVGVFLSSKKWRFGAEWIYGRGLIFGGTDGGAVPGSVNGSGRIASYNLFPEEEAKGGYVDIGYRIVSPLQFNVRYDLYRRGIQSVNNYRLFETWTLGTEYFWNRNLRLLLNHEIRSAKAPHLSKNSSANILLKDMGNRWLVQLTALF